MPDKILHTLVNATGYFGSGAEVKADEQSNVFSALGIDWQMLLFQVIGFSVLVFVMAKYIYPIFMKVVDERQAKIEESVKAADEAKQMADKAEADVQKVLTKARREASDIVSTAKLEASNAISAAEEKAKSRAEKIVASGHEQIKKDIQVAKQALHNETLELIAQATESIAKVKLDKDRDAVLVNDAVKGAAK
jgi:F-type H+-transporting ATPase subunit b